MRIFEFIQGRFFKIALFLLPSLLVIPQNAASQPSDYKTSVEEIIVICKTHFDLGYTHRVSEIVNYYRTDMIDNALKIMDSSAGMPEEQQFKWTAPGWVMYKVMESWDGQTPERHKKLEEAFRSGKFLTHAMPYTTETDACEPEVLVRGLGYASQLSRKYNLPLPISCKVTDVPSHAGALATVLANAGVKFIHIGCNWPSGFVKTPGLFWWQGPDGSRVLTLYSPIYGTSYGMYPKEWTSPNDPMIGENLLPAKDWPFKVWPAILVTPDNTGPPKSDQVKAMFAEVIAKLPGVKVRMGTMDDFVKSILAENPVLPVVSGEMPDTWIHGVMCDPGGMKLSRNTSQLLASAEALNTQLRIWGVKITSNAPEVAESYGQIGLYGEHTFGGAEAVNIYGDEFKKIDPGKYSNLEASWEDKTNYIRKAHEIADQLSESNLEALAEEVKYSGKTIVVYNPLPWKRSGLIETEGRQIFVRDVPPGGYLTVPVTIESAKPQDIVSDYIENQFYKITFDSNRGSIVSLIDKRTGREWAGNENSSGIGQYMNERFTFEQTLKYVTDYQQKRGWHSFGSEGEWLHPAMHKPNMFSEKVVPYRKVFSGNAKLTIVSSSLSQTAILDMPADLSNHKPATRLKVTLTDNQPYIDLEITIIDKAKDNWPEADWLCLPFNIRDPVFKVYRPLGVMNPVTDILRGANKNLYTVGLGVTLTDADGSGISVCPLDHPLISLDTPGCWKFDLEFVPEKPVVYVNLYNNQWNTNFRYWYPGTWSSRVRIRTFDKSTGIADVISVPALEARNPLQAIIVEGKGGKLPAQGHGVSVSRKGVLITAFGDDPDENEGTLIRVWEQAGVSGDLTIILPEGMKVKKATPVNLRGEKTGEPIDIMGGTIRFDLKAYAPCSFILN